jgi:uncharacterized protein (TIGR01370 family)
MIGLVFSLLFSATVLEGSQGSFAAYYSKVDLETVPSCDYILLDPEAHPSLKPLLENNVKPFGYLSLGEVSETRWYFETIRDRELLLHEQNNFPGSWFVDIREKKWHRFLVNQVIPKVLEKGFQGLLLDTLDHSLYLESEDPISFKGMRESAIELVEAIRNRYPNMPIVLNKGLELIDEVGDLVSFVLAEDVVSRFNFSSNEYEMVPESEQKVLMGELKKIKKLFPHVNIWTLDYWKEGDTSFMKEIAKKEKAQGFTPYVATYSLKNISSF